MDFEEARQVFSEEMGTILRTIVYEMNKSVEECEAEIMRHERFGRSEEAAKAQLRAARYTRIMEAAELLKRERYVATIFAQKAKA